MHRAVETQVNAFAFVRETASQTYLLNQWTSFLERQTAMGKLIDFLDVLQRSKPTSVIVQRQSFRRLSPGNPYAEQYAKQNGDEVEIQPATLALRLNGCREQLAETWVDHVEKISHEPPKERKVEEPVEPEKLDAPPTKEWASTPDAGEGQLLRSGAASAGDQQLLHGMAMKLAVKEMLHDLSIRPSQRLVKEWLASYLLVKHGKDLTKDGSVDNLLQSLASQPLHIRGGILVDPLEIEHEIIVRTADILEYFSLDLKDAPTHTVPLASSFLENCFLL